ncbi:site-specific DNA-methyltransferase [Micromonospora sp. ANENR4]|uniref:site-specific DNA-methyltransferase n=1 Tax=Micromonospora sp. ANENR4 TaxID=2783662 RepID=UPI00188EF58B|nr:site-specific DNA-methyltransferase [Micromonospora sp. ANENR4]MBF5034034.1 site-specific DNA-methyltransferase [Micromonospora sp. ANENR4]
MAKHSGGLELTWSNKDKALLSIGDGKYDYTFVERSDYRVSEVRLLHRVERIEAPAPQERPDHLPVPTTANLLITGDAMHVLDALTKNPEYADEYLGKVKLVYIDPPFNTGKVFDKYEDNISHSIWLTLLRDRLRQIKPLLADDGSVWVHLDNSEVHRCRAVMDEELGAENFVDTIIWGKADTSRNDANQFSTDQDYLLVYSKREGWRPNRLPRSAAQDAIYSSPDGDPHPWLAKPGHAPGAKTHPGMVYAIQSPFTGKLLYPPAGGCWRLGEDRMYKALNQWAPYKRVLLDDADVRAAICDLPADEIREVEAMLLDVDLDVARGLAERRQAGVLPEVYFINDGSLVQVKGYKPEGVVPRTIWPFQAVGSNRNSKAEIKALFPKINPFSTPKPERLLQRIIQLSTNPGDIVLDCFAGSGSTAAVAHKMGRRWVTSELLSENVETFIKPRLMKVVNGRDLGGVSTAKERVAADGVVLPSGVSPEAAQAFQKTLRKILRGADEPMEEADHEDDGASEASIGGDPPLDPPPALTVALDKELAKVVRATTRAGNSPLDPEEVKALLALVRKLGSTGDVTLDITKSVKSALLNRTKTVDAKTTLWHGGGGFTHLVVGPSMFTEVAGVILLAEWATHGDLAKAMCAQLGVQYLPDGIFAAMRGKVRYVILDGLVGESTVAAIVDQLPEGQIVEVWATQIDPDAGEALRKTRKGSRLTRIPDAVLDTYRRRAVQESPFQRRIGEDGRGA